MASPRIPRHDGPGCGHDVCLFERHCLVLQAEVELADARAERAFRRARGRTWAQALGLRDAEGPLLEVIAYSPDLAQRTRAANLLCMALRRRTAQRAA